MGQFTRARHSWVRKVFLSFSRKERRGGNEAFAARQLHGVAPFRPTLIPGTLPRNYFPDKSSIVPSDGGEGNRGIRCITGYYPPKKEKVARENPPYLPRPFEARLMVTMEGRCYWSVSCIYIYTLLV